MAEETKAEELRRQLHEIAMQQMRVKVDAEFIQRVCNEIAKTGPHPTPKKE